MGYWTFRVFYFLLSSLGRKNLMRLARVFGWLMYTFMKKRRRVAEINCKTIGIPDDRTEEVVRENFRITAKTYCDIFDSGKYRVQDVDKHLNVRYTFLSDEELPFGKEGCILLTGHMGLYESNLLAFCRKFKLEGLSISRALRNMKIFDFLANLRSSSIPGLGIVSHRDVADQLTQALKDKKIIIGFLDHSASGKDSIYVPFFGVKTSFIKGFPMMSVRQNVPVLPVFGVQEEDGINIIIYPVMRPDESLKPRERIVDMARRMNEVYEDIISKYPEQWYLIHKRFKHTEDENGKVTNSFYRQRWND